MFPYYSFNKYPSWCICCIEPKYLKNKSDAYYHIKIKPMSSLKKAKANSKSPSDEHTPQTIGKKRPAANSVSKELELFYSNCDVGGTIYVAQANEPRASFF